MYNDIIQFIRQLYNEPKEFIPLHSPFFWGNEKKYVNDCIETTFVSSVGKYVDRFEEMTADYTGVKKSVACVNGTCALHLALKLIGVEQNDEVITQPLTFIATANAIAHCNAAPVIIDVDKETMGLSPLKMKEWLLNNTEIKNNTCYNKTTNRRVKACISMHTFGHPVQLDELVQLCNEYHIELIEDSAESIGSFYKDKHTGTFGKIGVLSFNGNKTITTGGGGMLLFNDENLATHAKHLTTQAKVSHRWEFVHDEIGYNYRMPNVNAALGCAQMENLQVILNKKRELAQKYKQYFMNTDIKFFDEPKDCKSNFWLNSIILKDKEEQYNFLKKTNNSGVMTRPIWELMNRLPMFERCQCGDIENANWYVDRIVNLPSGINKK